VRRGALSKEPEAFVVTMTGTDFGVGEGLSDAARHGLPALIHRIEELIDLDSTQGGPTGKQEGKRCFSRRLYGSSGVTIRD